MFVVSDRVLAYNLREGKKRDSEEGDEERDEVVGREVLLQEYSSQEGSEEGVKEVEDHGGGVGEVLETCEEERKADEAHNTARYKKTAHLSLDSQQFGAFNEDGDEEDSAHRSGPHHHSFPDGDVRSYVAELDKETGGVVEEDGEEHQKKPHHSFSLGVRRDGNFDFPLSFAQVWRIYGLRCFFEKTSRS